MKDEKGRWIPGTSGNPKGRPKNSKNKFSKEQKAILAKILGKFASLTALENDLEQCAPKDRLAILDKYMKYFLSTTKQVKNKIEGEVKVTVKHKQVSTDNKNIDNINESETM